MQRINRRPVERTVITYTDDPIGRAQSNALAMHAGRALTGTYGVTTIVGKSTASRTISRALTRPLQIFRGYVGTSAVSTADPHTSDLPHGSAIGSEALVAMARITGAR